MKKFAVSAFAVAMVAGSAVAQLAPVHMDLRIVRQTGGSPPNVPGSGTANAIVDVDANSSFTTSPGAVLRFEVQYRLLDNQGGANALAGLSGLQMDITSSTTTAALSRAILSGAEIAPSIPARPPRTPGQPAADPWLNPATAPFRDTSGVGNNPLVPPNNERGTGVHAPFRGGFSTSGDNNLPANGVISPLGILGITPLTISQSNQGKAGFSTRQDTTDPDNPVDTDFLAGGEWYGLYSFLVTVGSANVDLVAHSTPDAATGNRFAFWHDGQAVPPTSTDATDGFYHLIVPAPGAAALMGLGGLLVARRRRA